MIFRLNKDWNLLRAVSKTQEPLQGETGCRFERHSRSNTAGALTKFSATALSWRHTCLVRPKLPALALFVYLFNSIYQFPNSLSWKYATYQNHLKSCLPQTVLFIHHFFQMNIIFMSGMFLAIYKK